MALKVPTHFMKVLGIYFVNLFYTFLNKIITMVVKSILSQKMVLKVCQLICIWFFSHLIVASLLWKGISEGVFDALGVEEGNVMFL